MDGGEKKDSGQDSQTLGSRSDKRPALRVFSEAGKLGDECDLLRGVVSALHETIITGISRSGEYLFIWADPVLLDRYHLELSTLSGKTLYDVFPQEDAARRIEQTHEVFDKGRCFREEYPVDFPGGRFWHDATISPLRDEDGKVVACLGIIQDITCRKRFEHSLKESEDRCSSVVDQSSDFIVMHRAGKILFANRATARAAGVEDPDEMIGRSVLDLVHPDSRELVRRRMALVGDAPEILPPIGEKFIGRDGKVFYGEAIAQRGMFGGQPVILTTVRDISERREAEEELRMLQERIRKAQKQESLAILAGGVAHDFNNLLMGVLGNASIVLSEMDADSPWYDRLCAIEKTSLRAAELTRKLLAYSGGGRFVLQAVDLADLCREMVGLLRASISSKIEFRFEIDPQLPPVSADATQIRQVIMNLFLNAAEAIGDKAGTIDVRTRALDAGSDLLSATFMQSDIEEGPCVSLVVADNGCGMDPDTRERMFDPFFSTKGSGRGLGLAAVLGIVHGHGGALRVDSETGAGTKFELLFPLADATVAGAVTARPAKLRPANWRPEGLLLLADDEEHVREVVRETLAGPNADVLEACDGQEAVDLFEQRPGEFAAAVLDMTMPRLSGSEALDRLRQMRPDLPVVLTSGYSDIAGADIAGGGTRSVFLAKPFRPSELLDALYNILPCMGSDPDT